MAEPQPVRARDNPLLLQLRRLLHEPGAYRRNGIAWLEGEHLCTALRARGRPAEHAVITESAWQGEPALRELAGWAPRVTVVADPLFKGLSGLASPARIGFLIGTGGMVAPHAGVRTVVLDRLQDAGNVGSILRSSAAFGVLQVVGLKGTAALWSPKVLRAAMGAHFALRLVEGLADDALAALEVPLVATASGAGTPLHEAALPEPCGWVFGNEGQGIAAALSERCALQVHIPQPGGEESLNVAAAAAVCLYESSTRRIRPR
jgi:TrmH family RNA methyltransferase